MKELWSAFLFLISYGIRFRLVILLLFSFPHQELCLCSFPWWGIQRTLISKKRWRMPLLFCFIIDYMKETPIICPCLYMMWIPYQKKHEEAISERSIKEAFEIGLWSSGISFSTMHFPFKYNELKWNKEPQRPRIVSHWKNNLRITSLKHKL